MKGKARDRVITGFHTVREALLEGVPLHALFIEKGKHRRRAEEIRRLARARGVKVLEVPKEKLGELQAESWIAALVSEVAFLSLEELLNTVPPEEAPLFVVLDGITDVGNAGAIARTAEAMGAHGLILQERNSPFFGEAAARVSAGAIWHLPMAKVKNLNRALSLLKDKGVWIAATVPSGGIPLHSFDFTLPTAVVLGSESEGIRRSVKEKADVLITIRQKGKVQSLNVSVAAGMVLYEAAKQRGWL